MSVARSRTWLVPVPPALPPMVVTLAVGVASFALFAVLAVAIGHGKVPALDSIAVPDLGHSGRSGAVRHLFRIVGEAGGAPGTLLILAAVVVVLVVAGRPWSGVFFGLAVACSAVNPLLKDAFDRHGPPHVRWFPGETGFFPSGHAVGSMAVAAGVVALTWQTRFRLAGLAASIAFVIAIGLSAVLTGDHWPSDVLGGWALSVGWVACVSSATAAWARRRTASARPASIPAP